MANIGHPTPPLNYTDAIRGLREISVIVQRVMQGKTNNAGAITLDTNQSTTTIIDERVGANSKISLIATNAAAAVEAGAGVLYISSVGDSAFVLTHTNDTTTRTFDYFIAG